MTRAKLPGTPGKFPDWRELYKNQAVETMPWYYAPLDPDVERALLTYNVTAGRALDLGTGPGTQAFALAERGLEVTGSDLAERAVELARLRAEERGLAVSFIQDDILDTRLEGPFELIVDRGCFHVFAPALRADYLRAVCPLLLPGGLLLLKCFSEQQPGEQGPYRFAPDEIRQIFAAEFVVHAIERTVYQGGLDPLPQALFCIMERRQD